VPSPPTIDAPAQGSTRSELAIPQMGVPDRSRRDFSRNMSGNSGSRPPPGYYPIWLLTTALHPHTPSALTSLLIRPSLNSPFSRLCCAVLVVLSSRDTPAGISHACSGSRIARSRARRLMAQSPAGNSSEAPGSCRSTSRSISVKPQIPPRNSLAHLRTASWPNELPRWLAFTRDVFPLASTSVRKASLCFAFYPHFLGLLRRFLV
jgi:hypothetical protein